MGHKISMKRPTIVKQWLYVVAHLVGVVSFNDFVQHNYLSLKARPRQKIGAVLYITGTASVTRYRYNRRFSYRETQNFFRSTLSPATNFTLICARYQTED